MRTYIQQYLLLCLLFLPTYVLAAGMKGTYNMTGTAYAHGKVLRKVVLVFTVGEKQIVVRTTKTGAYWVQISWETPCPNGSGLNSIPARERVFPRYFTVDWNDKTVRIKSHTICWLPGDTFTPKPNKVIVPLSNEEGFQKDIIQNLYFK